MKIGEKIKQLRKYAGMSHEDVAAKLGVSRPAVSNWERGVNNPSMKHLTEIANLFGVPLTDFQDISDKSLLNDAAHKIVALELKPEDLAKIAHQSVIDAWQIAENHDLEFTATEFAKLVANRALKYAQIRISKPNLDDESVNAAATAALDNVILFRRA